MKKILAVIVMMGIALPAHTQVVNWLSLRGDQSNVIQINAGYDYGATLQFGYGHKVTLIRPILLGADCSLPMGSDLIDDFKVRIGGQIEIVEAGGFITTVRISSVFRRFQSQLVRILSFGSDFALIAGYYTSSWCIAAEGGFDKSVTSHIKNADILKEYYPGIRDGWYVPTGGNFYYGIQAGKTIGRMFDLSLRVGATQAQNHDENAVLPVYAQLGLGMRF
jgi:hypothetical protein